MANWIDVNTSLGPWPFRRLRGESARELVRLLRDGGATQAWVGSLDGLFQRDVAAVNERLVQACRDEGDGLLIPFGTVNPALPDWEEDLRQCHEVHRMPGIRLHPNYQGYRLDEPSFAALLEQAASRRLIVQLVVSMEDERTQHPVFRVPHVDIKPLETLLPKVAGLKLVLLNAFRAARVGQVANLAQLGNLWSDIAMLEGSAALSGLLDAMPAGRVLFGSHAPLFVWMAADWKLRESGRTGAQLQGVRSANAQGLRELN